MRHVELLPLMSSDRNTPPGSGPTWVTSYKTEPWQTVTDPPSPPETPPHLYFDWTVTSIGHQYSWLAEPPPHLQNPLSIRPISIERLRILVPPRSTNLCTPISQVHVCNDLLSSVSVAVWDWFVVRSSDGGKVTVTIMSLASIHTYVYVYCRDRQRVRVSKGENYSRFFRTYVRKYDRLLFLSVIGER